MPLLKELNNPGQQGKILLLGSGGLSIGQAGEFDYSGTQAVKAMREEGLEVIIINPNIATVQTNPEAGVKVYLYPVELEWVEKVIELERPSAIMASFGGQTALNCLMALDRAGILQVHNIINLGTPASVLRMTEDRDEFAQKMKEIHMPVPASVACDTLEAALKAVKTVGFPVIVRAAYALGGLGSGFANNERELEALVTTALAASPQVLVEKSLKGWKEVEYEVMRDAEGNVITICNMENFDPLGIHTGDSIVVAPSQTLSDNEYQILRNAAIDIVGALGVVGECNVQYALSPDSMEFYVIEVNARLSRSSALASKATGYPIAYIAAKVVLGYDLLELKNPVTGITYAFFEPALDYVTIKIPRWDLTKFPLANRKLDSTMKSVGEIMSIGRTFPEALQKAVRMITENACGLSVWQLTLKDNELIEALKNPTDTRLSVILESFRCGIAIDKIHQVSSIDEWFLYQLKEIVTLEKEIAERGEGVDNNQPPNAYVNQALRLVDEDQWQLWKIKGFGDEQIASILLFKNEQYHKVREAEITDASLVVRSLRLANRVRPVVKKIDTTAAEYPSLSNYLYLTYAGMYDDPLPEDHKVFSAIVLGGGAYRIGASVEFDWCAVSCSKQLQKAGWHSVIINCNPETVSTDYNSSDRLYFEELSLERILDIADVEKIVGVIACMGGQLPNRLTQPLARAGVKLLGHPPSTIDRAEDRSKFSALLDSLNIDQPRWIGATSKKDVEIFIEEVGFPVLIRPSYVLSGAAMNVAYDGESLERCLGRAADLSPDHPIVISEFLLGAREIELDGVAKNGEIITAVVSEHIENAGVHSGDATTVVPAQRLYVETVRRVRKAGKKIAAGLGLNGPFNIQFLAQEGEIKVIECNARAARSFPFVSKTVGINLADVATDIIIGATPNLARLNEDDLPFVGVKAAMFSFTRLAGADPVLGVEMASTGEVGCIGHDFEEALLLALQASNTHRPKKGVLVSSGTEKDKLRFLKSAEILQNLGISLYATEGTARHLSEHNIKVQQLDWPDEGVVDASKAIKEGWVDLVINIPKSSQKQELSRDSKIRQLAVKLGCALLTDMEKVTAFVHSLGKCPDFANQHEMLVLPPYRN